MPFLRSLRLDGFLSFPPGSEPIPLTPLNVLIGPNGSGKSNLIEAVELLHNTPTPTFSDTIRMGGGPEEWIWKGDGASHASITAEITPWHFLPDQSLQYGLSFQDMNQQVYITNESLQEGDIIYYNHCPSVKDSIILTVEGESRKKLRLKYSKLSLSESMFSQFKDDFHYPELTEVGKLFTKIQTFREWSFGRSALLRKPQRVDLPVDALLPLSENLALLINHLEYADAAAEFNNLLSRFLPRYRRFSTRIQGNTAQIYLHEEGLKSPIPATRLSDGTLRFMTMLALLLSPNPPPLLCIEEPELGLHPDAVILLADLIVEASKRMQIILTTHSDTLVGAFTEQTESVLVCQYLGGSVLERLESAKLRSWLDEYSLGDIWRIGVLGGNP